MKKLWIFLLAATAALFLLTACDGGGEKCTHLDKDDNRKCDACGADFEDGCDKHKDADDNGECDECSADFEDGCDAEHKDENDDGKCDVGGEDFDDGKEVAPGIIYDANAFPVIIHNEGEIAFVNKVGPAVRDYMQAHASVNTNVYNDTMVVFGHEIVIGDTTREITATAKDILEDKLAKKAAELEAEDKEIEDLAGYLIYSDGASVAIVWSDFQLAELATDYFCENYLNEPELILEAGYEKSDFFSLMGYLEEREVELFEEKWAELEAAIPVEYREKVMTELKKIYALYDDKSVDWITSLYDQETGGFYAAYSAKAVGLPTYGPDIEDTLYGLKNVVDHLGMAEMFGGDWTQAVPYELRLKAAEWIISLQDENGYYQHPQWPNPTDLRLTRDIGSAKTLIAGAGLKPKYSGANPSESNLTGKLASSTVAAVSKVVSVADTLSHFESVETFKAHLDEWEAALNGLSDSERAYKFYFYGSTFQSTAAYILANPEYIKMTVEFFDKHQNPENGVWSQNIYLDSTNAIHKIASVYNYMKAEIKYADKMIASTLALLNTGMPNADSTCEIYNVWSCFQYIYKNVRNYSSGTAEERAARCEALKAKAADDVVAAISMTYDHLIHYRYDDASFSYCRGYSLYSMCSAPCAVRGTPEGDLNGFLMATYNMPYFILAALELEDYFIQIYTEEDRVRYLDGIRNPKDPTKVEIEVSEPVIYDFEDATAGDAPEGVEIGGASGTYVKVAEDGTNKVLELKASDKSGINCSATFEANHTDKEPTASRLELTLKFDSSCAQGTNFCNLSVNYAATGKPLFKFSFKRTLSVVNLHDASGNKIAKVGNIGKLITIAIEYDWVAGEYKVYSGDTLIYTGSAIMDTTHAVPGSFTVSTPSGAKALYSVDDVSFKTYKEAE